MKFHLWTRFINTNTDIHSVAYGWGTQDSPFEFEHELLEQKAKITEKRQDDNVYKNLNWDNSQCFAPVPNWDNYVFPKRHRIYYDKDKKYSFYAYDGKDPNKDDNNYGGGNLSEEQHSFTLSIGQTVSIPGLGTCLCFLGKPGFPDNGRNPGNASTVPPGPYHTDPNDPGMWNFGPLQAQFTSGLDCSGFVWRSAMYDRGDGMTAYKAINRDASAATNLWRIAAGTKTGKYNDQPGNLDKVVPGDVLQWTGHHIVMVLYVSKSLDGITKRDNIKFIHSGSGQFDEWQVLSNLVWEIGSGLDDKHFFEYNVLRLICNP